MQTIKYACHALLVVLLFGCAGQQKEDAAVAKDTPPYKALIVQKNLKDTTWGYIIMQHDRELIRQFSIPAVEGNQPFRSKEQAALTGNLVAGKLNNSLRPAISKKELDSLGIIYLTNATQKK